MIRTNLTAVAALLAAGTALAQGGVGQPQVPSPAPGSSGTPGNTGEGALTFARCDEDGDGRISRGEAREVEGLSPQFRRLDRNGDGELDKAEFARLEMSGPATDESPRPSGSATRGADSRSEEPARSRSR